jgi:Phosphopantetheine attachment site
MTQSSQMKASDTQLTDGPLTNEDHHEPKSASEKYMASLWKEIIGLDQVRLQNKFADVGGNSLTLNIILTRIEKEKGASVEAELFFDPDRSSLFDLAKELDLALANPDRSRESASLRGCANVCGELSR